MTQIIEHVLTRDPDGTIRHRKRLRYPEFDGTQNCAQVDREIMFHEKQMLTVARVVCKDCPFLVECREWGLAHEEHGVWGGMTPRQRRTERSNRKQTMVRLEVDEWITVTVNTNREDDENV